MAEGSRDYLELGKWNAICDVCGFKFKSNEIQTRWDGLKVCGTDWEMRHSMDFLRAFPETSNILPYSRPQMDITVMPDVAPSPFEDYVVEGYYDIEGSPAVASDAYVTNLKS